MSHDCHLVAPARNSSLFTASKVGAAVLWRPLLIVTWRIVDCFFLPRMTGSAFLHYGRVNSLLPCRVSGPRTAVFITGLPSRRRR